jgi:cytochrome P450
LKIFDLFAQYAYSKQLNPGHIEKSDAVQIAFLLLVAGNATMVNMINLVLVPLSYHNPDHWLT